MDAFENIKQYFASKYTAFGNTPRGVDWNGEEAQELRFQQLLKVVDTQQPFSLLDFGSGPGALVGYLKKNNFLCSQYFGYEIVEPMLAGALEQFPDSEQYRFTSNLDDVPVVDYAVASGVFNIKLDAPVGAWTSHVLDCLHAINSHTKLGFAINFLTKYSDADRMRPDLYYADPLFLFDYLKMNFSRNVALLHDYQIYDFTLIVRKN